MDTITKIEAQTEFYQYGQVINIPNKAIFAGEVIQTHDQYLVIKCDDFVRLINNLSIYHGVTCVTNFNPTIFYDGTIRDKDSKNSGKYDAITAQQLKDYVEDQYDQVRD